VWAAEPKLENRHRSGIAVVIFLLFATAFGYLAYRQIWAEAKRKVRPTGVLDPENQAKNRQSKAESGVAG
jgi:ubiquinol-cytochrome c reductase cytochrome c1 subunit